MEAAASSSGESGYSRFPMGPIRTVPLVLPPATYQMAQPFVRPPAPAAPSPAEMVRQSAFASQVVPQQPHQQQRQQIIRRNPAMLAALGRAAATPIPVRYLNSDAIAAPIAAVARIPELFTRPAAAAAVLNVPTQQPITISDEEEDEKMIEADRSQNNSNPTQAQLNAQWENYQNEDFNEDENEWGDVTMAGGYSVTSGKLTRFRDTQTKQKTQIAVKETSAMNNQTQNRPRLLARQF